MHQSSDRVNSTPASIAHQQGDSAVAFAPPVGQFRSRAADDGGLLANYSNSDNRQAGSFQATAQLMRFSNQNSFYGDHENIPAIPIEAARVIFDHARTRMPADQSPLETMIEVPGLGLKWVEIRQQDMAALFRRGDTFTDAENTAIETGGADDIHAATDGAAAGVSNTPAPLAHAAEGADTTLAALVGANQALIPQLRTFNNPQTTNNYNVQGVPHQVTYTRSGNGGIDFHTPDNATRTDNNTDVTAGWAAAHVDAGLRTPILITVNGHEYIDYVSKGKYVYPWASNRKARSTHFRAANFKNGLAGDGQPNAGWTWHHEEAPRGTMVPVRTEVHKRHGHNGGVALW